MKRLSTSVVCAALCAVCSSLAGQDPHPSIKAQPQMGAKVLTTTPDQLKWVETPGTNGVKTATAWGVPEKGAHGAFHKFPAGWTSPLHTHSADVRAVVISGTWIQGTEDGKETKLPAGSYVYQPHGVKHVTKCDTASECLVFVVANAKFDLIPAGEKKAEDKK